MSPSDADLTDTIARHEREIADLRAQVQEIRDGRARDQLEWEIARRVAELEADLKLMELQEAMTEEPAQRSHWRRFFRVFP
jgi:chromosome segregation ATPase